ncbi:uracil-DNA glycosylase family protein [Thioclava sp. FR2]|uniref:uracil-DNA glycosylase family protein n=1 Tax=Thioclava sp. FR2 TaxID=3445780 RepID=UPI003EB6DB23
MSHTLTQRILACRLCENSFHATRSGHTPRPVAWFHRDARLLIAGQAPGARVHASGKPFTDPSGDRLRDWLGLDENAFYEKCKIAIVPMAFCFPGYDAKGADLPPPRICAQTWRAEVMGELSNIALVLAVGSAAIRWHLGQSNVTVTVRGWRDWYEKTGVFPLPHPSWRNTAWLKRNPWFAEELLPDLRRAVASVLEMPDV